MRKSKVSLLILAVVVTVSGCSFGGGGEEPSSGDAIAVERFEVVPQTIYSGANVSATLNVRNVGNTAADIDVGEQGTNVLKSYTPDLLMIEDFDAESTANTETAEEYTLQPDETLSMNWDLHQFDESRIRFYADQQIDMAFQVPFEYKVEAYQQYQVKEDGTVTDLENLGSASSNGPMDIHIEMIGSSSEHGPPVFLEEDNIQVRVEFRNQDSQEGDGVGLIDIEAPEIKALSENVDVENCNTPENIQVTADSSTSITCNVNIQGEVNSSLRDEIQVTSDYKFTKTVSKDHIKVKYRG